MITPVAGSVVTHHVTFSKPFKNIYGIFANASSTVPQRVSLSAGNQLEDGFDIFLYRETSAETRVNWIAFGSYW